MFVHNFIRGTNERKKLWKMMSEDANFLNKEECIWDRLMLGKNSLKNYNSSLISHFRHLLLMFTSMKQSDHISIDRMHQGQNTSY